MRTRVSTRDLKRMAKAAILAARDDIRTIDLSPWQHKLMAEDFNQLINYIDSADIKVTWSRGR